jgi:hypothetical protein
MVGFLFGVQLMRSLQTENNIWQEQPIDLHSLVLSPSLQDQLTLQLPAVKAEYSGDLF